MFVAGEDHAPELEKVNASIDRLRNESDAGLIVSGEDERMYLERMKALIDRRTKLEQLPSRSAGWITEETGQTYGEAWAAAGDDHDQRRRMIVDSGIRFVLNSGKPAPQWGLHTPLDRIPLTMSPEEFGAEMTAGFPRAGFRTQ